MYLRITSLSHLASSMMIIVSRPRYAGWRAPDTQTVCPPKARFPSDANKKKPSRTASAPRQTTTHSLATASPLNCGNVGSPTGNFPCATPMRSLSNPNLSTIAWYGHGKLQLSLQTQPHDLVVVNAAGSVMDAGRKIGHSTSLDHDGSGRLAGCALGGRGVGNVPQAATARRSAGLRRNKCRCLRTGRQQPSRAESTT